MWLPADAYGLTKFTLHDLGPGPGSFDESRANDLNEQGFAAGARQFNNAQEFHAFLWNPNFTLASYDPQRISNLGVLPPEASMGTDCSDSIGTCTPQTGSENSEAFAVNNRPFIPQGPLPNTAGASQTITDCTGLPGSTQARGFYDAVPGTDGELDLDLRPTEAPYKKYRSQAYGLTTHNLTGEAFSLAVGFAFDSVDDEGVQTIPVYWENSLPSGVECVAALPFQDFIDGQKKASARDINDSRNIVGFGCFQPNLFSLCGIERPLYWHSHSDDRDELPPPAGMTDLTAMRAVAISERVSINGQDTVRVAGWAHGNEPPNFNNEGVLWEQVNGGAWNGWNLNDLVPSDDFKVIAAYDVNAMDQAWIVGVGVRNGSNIQRAILLTPLKNCPEDFVPAGGNGVVNIDDLVAVLTKFGASDCSMQSNTGSLDLQITDISNDFTVGWPDEFGVITPSPMVADAWAAQQAIAPLTVLRLWAVVDENAAFTYAGGGASSGTAGASEPLILNPGKNAQFFVANNNYSSGVNVALLDIDGGPGYSWFQSQAWATHLLMGTASDSPSRQGNIADLDGILTGSVNSPDSGWAVIGPAPGQGVVPYGNGGTGGWRILIGQFAIPQGSTFTAAVRLAGDGIDTYATINSGTISEP